jgi:hypothetical protein
MTIVTASPVKASRAAPHRVSEAVRPGVRHQSHAASTSASACTSAAVVSVLPSSTTTSSY